MQKKRFVSLRGQTLLALVVIVVPLLAVIFFFNLYTAQRSNQRVYESSLDTLSLYRYELDSSLQQVENLMLSLVAYDSDFNGLRVSLPAFRVLSNVYNVTTKFDDFMNAFDIIGAMYLNCEVNEIGRVRYNAASTYSYAEKLALDSLVQEILDAEGNPASEGWLFRESEGRHYLLRFLGTRELYTLCVVDPLLFKTPQRLRGEGAEDGVLLFTNGSEPVALPEALAEDGIEFRQQEDSFFLTGRDRQYFGVYALSAYSGVGFTYLLPYSGTLGNLDATQLLLLVASLLLVAMIPLVWFLLNRANFRPMARLLEAMQRIREGEHEARMEESYRIREFSTLSGTFNGMMDEIRDLRIESYERALAEQKTRYLLLQSQIRPHFYLNCLKNVQALAQQQRYQEVQSLVLELSHYLRHLFRDGESMIPLAEELESVGNYINLQQMVSSLPPACTVELPPDLHDVPVPPLSVLTFVENAIKHGSLPHRQLRVSIKAMRLRTGEGDYVNLIITDNGRGFDGAVLDKLNHDTFVPPAGHIGIVNVRKRLALLYGGRCDLLFSNGVEGGRIEIFFPLDGGGQTFEEDV